MVSAVTTYAPAVLLVEDDRPAREYFRDKFNDETSLGVVVAKDLREARHLLESKVQIDAIVADLFFDFDKDDPESDLRDGLDILSLSKHTHPSILQYVNSFWTDRGEYSEKAQQLRLPIRAWFSKQFRLPGDNEAPWAQVERDLLQERLLNDKTVSEVPRDRGNMATVTEAIRQAICPTRRTYLQELNSLELVVNKPIEVLCWRSDDALFHASAYKLGLLTDGTGDTVREALDMLKDLLEEHFTTLHEATDDPEDYSGFVAARLREYISPQGSRS